MSVRRVSNWGNLSDSETDEISPEIVNLLKVVKELFSKSLPAHQVKKIEWIINPKLEEKFENTRQLLQKRGRSTTEVILFHGTAQQNINPYLTHLHDLKSEYLQEDLKLVESEDTLTHMDHQWFSLALP